MDNMYILSDNADEPIKLKDGIDIVYEKNKDGSYYKGHIAGFNGSLKYHGFISNFFNILVQEYNEDTWITTSVNNIPLLFNNIDEIISITVSDKDIHNYLVKIQADRNLNFEQLYRLFYNNSSFLFDIKRYTHNGYRLVDFCRVEDVERFIEHYAKMAFRACMKYLESIEVTDPLEEDFYTVGYLAYVDGTPTEMIVDFDITYI